MFIEGILNIIIPSLCLYLSLVSF